MDKIKHKKYHILLNVLRKNGLTINDEKLFRELDEEHKKKIEKENKELLRIFTILILSILTVGNFSLLLLLGAVWYKVNSINPVLILFIVLQIMNCIFWSYKYIRSCL